MASHCFESQFVVLFCRELVFSEEELVAGNNKSRSNCEGHFRLSTHELFVSGRMCPVGIVNEIRGISLEGVFDDAREVIIHDDPSVDDFL